MIRKQGTCIAYRDGVIAGDKLMTYGSVKIDNDIKIATHRGFLFGVSGTNCPSLVTFRDWFFKRGKKVPIPGMDFTALVITPEGAIQVVGETGDYETLDMPFYAVGCGNECALGAMEAGATAEQAVRAACKWISGVGGDVDTLSLGSK